jgi:hypothetical protein
MLHLAFHHKLMNEPANRYHLHFIPRINPKRFPQVAALCRRVWKKHKIGGIPYAFSSPESCFNLVTGEYELSPMRYGLTCASFVLGIFDTTGLKLLDYDSWPVGREGDAEFQLKMIAYLEKWNASPEHINAVRKETGSVRFRPEEVAGASQTVPMPVKFANASLAGLRVMEMLQAQ